MHIYIIHLLHVIKWWISGFSRWGIKCMPKLFFCISFLTPFCCLFFFLPSYEARLSKIVLSHMTHIYQNWIIFWVLMKLGWLGNEAHTFQDFSFEVCGQFNIQLSRTLMPTELEETGPLPYCSSYSFCIFGPDSWKLWL